MLEIGTVKLKNWLVMAPMSGITNLPFRLIAKRLGAGLVTTEMISAMGLVKNQKKINRSASFARNPTVPTFAALRVSCRVGIRDSSRPRFHLGIRIGNRLGIRIRLGIRNVRHLMCK